MFCCCKDLLRSKVDTKELTLSPSAVPYNAAEIPQEATHWSIRVYRVGDTPWGIQLDVLFNCWRVVSIDPAGAVNAFNESAPDGTDVRPGDLVTQINGTADLQACRKDLELEELSEIKLALTRPLYLDIIVPVLDDLHFGADLRGHHKGVLVERLKEDGFVTSHNLSGVPENKKLLKDDIIVAVESTTGEDGSAKMIQILKELPKGLTEVHLQVVRTHTVNKDA